MKNKKLLLFSGGTDSTVQAHILKSKNVEFIGLSFYDRTNGENTSEIECAKKTASRLNFEHLIYDNSNLTSTLLNKPNTKICVGGSINNCTKGDIIPAFFGVELLHYISIFYALNNNCEEIIWCIHKDDLNKTSKSEIIDYLNILEYTVKLRTGKTITFNLPFIDMTKKEVVNLGIGYNVNFDETYSCSSVDNTIHCGECYQCNLRFSALQSISINTI